MAAKRFNAVTLEMLWTRLISIVDEAAAALVRTSFSTIVRESNDFACVLTDARGLSLAHAPDIGGRIRSPDARDVFEEGLQIPIMKALDAGRMDPTLERLLRKNVRVPDQVMGDLHAQFTALTLMESRVIALLKEQKLESLADLGCEIHKRSEAAMRAAIRDVPN